ncbi:MAG: heavy metal translocating P-type ATPase [Haloferacaceae archaeon]
MTSCTLCDLPTPDEPITDPEVEGAFCCQGCLEVTRTLGAAEDDREAVDPRAELDTGPDAADGEEAYLSVEGMHCTTCEAFLESRATDQEGVLAASANYPAGVLKLVYDPEATSIASVSDVVEGLGYRVREGDDDPDTQDTVGRLLVGGFFGMMVMCWYVLFLYPTYLGAGSEPLLDVGGSAGAYLLWNVWAMSSVVLGYTGFPLLRGAYVSLRAGYPNMDLLAALAAGAAYLYSSAVVVLGGTEVYFDVAIVIVMAVTVGNYYEDRIRAAAATSLGELTQERVDHARRRTADGTETVAIEELDPGDEVVVRAGERVPVDGVVVDGTAAVDESLVTGESLPVRKEPGAELIGGSLVTEGGVRLSVAEDATSTLDQLVSLLWDVQSSRPGVQRLVDRLAAVFVPLVFVLAVLATGWHLLTGAAPVEALLIGLTVLIVSCPCALGLATPLAISTGVRTALDRGIVVTDASAFERAPEIETVAFDKTGTLTTGAMRVLRVECAEAGPAADGGALADHGDDEVLRRAAAVEQFADHPVAGAIVDAADPVDAAVTEFEQHPGAGVSARVEGERVVVGRRELFPERDWAVPEALADAYEAERDRGTVPALVGWAGRARGLVVAGDSPRPEWRSVVSELAADRRVVVITGDDGAAAARFREHEDVDQVFAGVRPGAKAEVVARLQTEGPVLMVGDGSNDAPALAAADLGVALERGTHLAADAADAVITTDDLATLPRTFEILDGTHRRIRENLAWALCYNAIGIPLAVAGVLNPLFAAVAMATSSLLVVLNSVRSLGSSDDGREASEATPAARPEDAGREASGDGDRAGPTPTDPPLGSD